MNTKNKVIYQTVVVVQSLSCVQLFATPWTVGCQAPLSMGFPRQEYQSGLPFLSPQRSFQPRDQARVSYISRWVAQRVVSACRAGDLGSIFVSGRSPGEGNGNPLRYSCLSHGWRNLVQATVHGVTKSKTRLSNFTFTYFLYH